MDATPGIDGENKDESSPIEALTHIKLLITAAAICLGCSFMDSGADSTSSDIAAVTLDS